MTVLAQDVVLQFGNLRYDTHVITLDADLALLPGVNFVRCLLPPSARVEAAPGDSAEVTLDNGETEAKILTGTVYSVARRIRGTEVVAVDAGAALAATRPATTYNAMSAVDVIRSLASDADADVGLTTVAPETLAVYFADQGRTGAEHIARLAALAGGHAYVDADGEIVVEKRPSPPASAALRYGRELLDFRTDRRPAPSSISMIGSGAAGSGGDPRALLATTEAISGGADDPGARSIWRPSAVIRAPGAQRASSEEAMAARGAATQRMTADCWLLPDLRPGQMIEVQDLPGEMSGGPWLLTAVRHRVGRRRGGHSRLEAVFGNGGGLLGALAGLAGGLL